jgi:hypothetical protein
MRHTPIGQHSTRSAWETTRADRAHSAHTVSVLVPALLELVSAMLGLGLLIALMRWTFGTGKGGPAPRVEDPDDPTGFGLLEEVSVVPTATAAEVLRSRLGAQGIRATVSRAEGGGYRLLVFPDDAVPARVVLSRGALGN